MKNNMNKEVKADNNNTTNRPDIIIEWLKAHACGDAIVNPPARTRAVLVDLMTGFQRPSDAACFVTAVLALGRLARERGLPGVTLQQVTGLAIAFVHVQEDKNAPTAEDVSPVAKEVLIQKVPRQVKCALRVLWDLSEIKTADVDTGVMTFNPDGGQGWQGLESFMTMFNEDKALVESLLKPNDLDTVPPDALASLRAIMRDVFAP